MFTGPHREAQLHTRHWVLRQADGGADQARGKGGRRDDKQRHSGRIGQGEWCEGVFVYQSLSGRGSSISFEGSIDFVPGSLEAPTGEEFAVAVPRFPLLVGADEDLWLAELAKLPAAQAAEAAAPAAEHDVMEEDEGDDDVKSMFGEQQMSALADYIRAALMLKFNQRTVG
ncbi:hypothetical protein EMIHUDRAFT_223966 [Emiliania huxleyi CCMP1516]|uniref:ApaG domain-containing protein n=2 Tax=Emiliania huxleyi TaxID=2903 RepID=A0A0D3KTJ5_EMIH1|nr:hypothetical protein EMIHUDRAFT_223966 [Emiliania huxleyi CCMP1516]EOD39080.1 hypothetical protein EMIHUDRAFT_223966 [Emiliania huxleyi CCMP1516]|eukprot:XP_005791509.1 hypothetical protein EMIHUDRAFT_223966 [Emiliania huxleyi CCMP1516]